MIKSLTRLYYVKYNKNILIYSSNYILCNKVVLDYKIIYSINN